MRVDGADVNDLDFLVVEERDLAWGPSAKRDERREKREKKREKEKKRERHPGGPTLHLLGVLGRLGRQLLFMGPARDVSPRPARQETKRKTVFFLTRGSTCGCRESAPDRGGVSLGGVWGG